VTGTAARAAAVLLAIPIRVYRYAVSPLLPMSCRFVPTCSDYALDALSQHGPVHGMALAIRRLARCHPWGGQGLDPVPPHTHDHCGQH